MVTHGKEDFIKPLKRSTIPDCLAYRSEHQPAKPYVIYGHTDREITYREMNEKANTMGNTLLDLSTSDADQTIAVMLKNPLPVIFTYYGVLKSGSIFAPIHVEYKGQNLTHLLNDSNSEVLIIDDRYIERINRIKDDLKHVEHVIVRETDDESEPLDNSFDQHSFESLQNGPATEPQTNRSWDDVGTIIYTSGTTGLPKGVLHSHRQALMMFADAKATFMGPDDIVHNNLPLFHVGGLYGNILATLVAGSTVVCWDKFSTNEFWDRIEEYQATRAVIFSSMITWLNNQPQTETDHHNTLNKVTFNPLVDEYQEIADRFGFDIIDTYYGQTEICLVTGGVIQAAQGDNATPEEYSLGRTPAQAIELAEEKGMPVVDSAPGANWTGKPAFPVEVTLVDEDDETRQPGEVGELVARPSEPSMIFHGYVNNPEATLDVWDNLWHHTEDALKRDEDGNYYFVDRINDVIRRRGENIATAQIEEPLKSCDEIDNVAAFAVPAVDGEEDEVAIAVEVNPKMNLDPGQVRELATDELPNFMVPRYVRILDKLPTTETTKVEKYKLREQIIEEENLS